MHCDFITIDGEKISKSLGNTFSLGDLSERGFSPMDYKMWVLSGHYQGTRNFTFESLEAAKQRRLNWRNKIALLHQRADATEPGFSNAGLEFSSTSYTGTRAEPSLRDEPVRSVRNIGVENSNHFMHSNKPDSVAESILDAINNNLNSAEAFAVIDTSELAMEDWRKVDELFGLRLMADSPDIDDETREMIAERQTAREAKNYAESDRLRDLLAERGIGVLDTADGPVWQYLI